MVKKRTELEKIINDIKKRKYGYDGMTYSWNYFFDNDGTLTKELTPYFERFLTEIAYHHYNNKKLRDTEILNMFILANYVSFYYLAVFDKEHLKSYANYINDGKVYDFFNSYKNEVFNPTIIDLIDVTQLTENQINTLFQKFNHSTSFIQYIDYIHKKKGILPTLYVQQSLISNCNNALTEFLKTNYHNTEFFNEQFIKFLIDRKLLEQVETLFNYKIYKPTKQLYYHHISTNKNNSSLYYLSDIFNKYGYITSFDDVLFAFENNVVIQYNIDKLTIEQKKQYLTKYFECVINFQRAQIDIDLVDKLSHPDTLEIYSNFFRNITTDQYYTFQTLLSNSNYSITYNVIKNAMQYCRGKKYIYNLYVEIGDNICEYMNEHELMTDDINIKQLENEWNDFINNLPRIGNIYRKRAKYYQIKNNKAETIVNESIVESKNIISSIPEDFDENTDIASLLCDELKTIINCKITKKGLSFCELKQYVIDYVIDNYENNMNSIFENVTLENINDFTYDLIMVQQHKLKVPKKKVVKTRKTIIFNDENNINDNVDVDIADLKLKAKNLIKKKTK